MFRPGEHEKFVDLVSSVDPRRILEIGCHAGRTARVLLREISSIEEYIGVDVPMSYVPGLPAQQKETIPTPGMDAAHDPRFKLWILPLGSMNLRSDRIGMVDVVFIDGDHSRTVVRFDTDLARHVVRSGGLIVWHDAGNPAAQVDEILDVERTRGHEIHVIPDTWFAYERIP